MNLERIYDVCLSFAGEDRAYVRHVAGALQRSGVKYFYDEHNQVALWGKNLQEHLTTIYRDQSLFAVLFVSEHYAQKPWAVLERRAALEKAMKEFDREYVLPARFDDTELPGLLDSVSYVDLRKIAPVALADMIVRKLITEARAKLPPEGFWEIDSTGFKRIERANGKITISLVDEDGKAIPNVHVCLSTIRGTYKSGSTAENGAIRIDLPNRELQTIYCAKPGYFAHLVEGFDPVDDLEIQLAHLKHGGSMVFSGWGQIPELGGRLIIQGSQFIAARNLTLEGNVQRIHPDSSGRFPYFNVRDADGNRAFVKVLHHQPNNCALLQYAYRD